MLKKLLIANRGEIACRIIKTAKRLGVQTVAVYSNIDAEAEFVDMADEAYLLGPAPSQESYLCSDKILAIAKDINADAIHPGYGFLAEDPAFAAACEQAGIIFVGPPASAIEQMGSKDVAKRCMIKAGVPVVPGYQETNQDIKILTDAAKKIGVPLLIKASAGGGGKGMRLVENMKDFEDALKGAKREAKASFGNDHMFLEKFIPTARHVELQIFADQHSNVVYLFDRDCSMQRRHQKIIEEAPAPNIDDAVRIKMAQAAVEAARTINYVNAGTIEFLLDGEQFYFMEMNTRLQVEHPVTEMITGFDLVEWQLRVASGEKLPKTQDEIKQCGHAFEARICAENPSEGFAPSVGEIAYLKFPEEQPNSIRIDTGFIEGDEVSVYYDSMIAKLIVWDEDRATALQKFHQALNATRIIGVNTNVPFINRITQHPEFKAAKIHTNFVMRNIDALLKTVNRVDDIALIFAAIHSLDDMLMEMEAQFDRSDDFTSPWTIRDGWRATGESEITMQFWHKNTAHSITATKTDFGIIANIQGETIPVHIIEQDEQEQLHIRTQAQNAIGKVIPYQTELHVFLDDRHVIFKTQNPALIDIEHSTTENILVASMPGTVVETLVKPGQNVNKGDKIMVVEAMKIEHVLFAPADGIVKNVFFNTGDPINEGVELVEFE